MANKTQDEQTTNAPADATDDYLAELGIKPDQVPDVDAISSLAYAPEDPMQWTGETYERLSGQFDFYRASTFDNGLSVKMAQKEGYVALPKGHDAKMKRCHDPEQDVIMIRRKSVSAERARQREEVRQRRQRATSVQSRGGHDATVYTQSRHTFQAQYRKS